MNYLLTLLLAGILYSSQAMASDFAVLGVAIGSLLIAALNIALGCWAFISAKKKGYIEALPFLGIIVFLSFIGVGIVMDEAGHMSDTDTVGMLATVIVPGIIAFIAPLFVRKDPASDAD